MNSSLSETSARKSRVFIVDDHSLVREGLTHLINGQDDLVVCGEAKDSAQAINGIAKARPDVALVDISLTNESGLELVKQLAKQFPGVALIILSMHVSERIVNRMARRVSSSREQVAGSSVESLSDRELEIFRLLGQGRTTSQIAADLNLSLKTVQAYCARAKAKFGVTSLTELLRAAIRWDDASQVK